MLLTGAEHGESQMCIAAEHATPEAVNQMAAHGRGLVCLAITPERQAQLGLPLMVPGREASARPYTASIEARRGVTTGISAHDRATTIRIAASPGAGPDDIVMPGHVFPVVARKGGVLVRAGLIEAAVDLARLAGLEPAAAVCTILREDGSLAGEEDLRELSDRFGWPVVRVSDVVAFRLRNESLVHRLAERSVRLAVGGRVRVFVYRNDVDPFQHVAVVKGRWKADEAVLTRVHSQCLTGDVFGSLRCDCGEQLQEALRRIERAGCGVLLYLHQEGRGIGLANKLRAYALQDKGRDTVEANLELGFQDDGRDYGIGAQILRDLGVQRTRLMTNNPKKIEGLRAYGIEVCERVPLECRPHPGNLRYLEAKRLKLGHLLSALKPVG